jgi:hypothetical protein
LIQEFVYIPEVLANLQANAVYWRECAEELEQKQLQEKANEAVATSLSSTSNNPNSNSSTSLHRTKSIVEDNEIEIE